MELHANILVDLKQKCHSGADYWAAICCHYFGYKFTFPIHYYIHILCSIHFLTYILYVFVFTAVYWHPKAMGPSVQNVLLVTQLDVFSDNLTKL